LQSAKAAAPSAPVLSLKLLNKMYHNELDPPKLDRATERYLARVQARREETMKLQRDLEEIRRRELLSQELSRVAIESPVQSTAETESGNYNGGN
jgi:hypothetical protein